MSAPGRPLRLAVLVETPAEQEPLRWCRGNILLASFEAAPMLDMACISPTTGWEGGGVAGCRLPLRSLVRAGFCVLAGEAADAVSAGSRPLELPLVSTSFSALAAMREESLAPIVNGNLQEGCHLPGQAGCPHLTPADLLCAVLHYRGNRLIASYLTADGNPKEEEGYFFQLAWSTMLLSKQGDCVAASVTGGTVFRLRQCGAPEGLGSGCGRQRLSLLDKPLQHGCRLSRLRGQQPWGAHRPCGSLGVAVVHFPQQPHKAQYSIDLGAASPCSDRA